MSRERRSSLTGRPSVRWASGFRLGRSRCDGPRGPGSRTACPGPPCCRSMRASPAPGRRRGRIRRSCRCGGRASARLSSPSATAASSPSDDSLTTASDAGSRRTWRPGSTPTSPGDGCSTARWRGAGRQPQRASLRRADRPAPDPLGRRSTADDLDRAAPAGRPSDARRNSPAATSTCSAPPTAASFAEWAGSRPGRAAFDSSRLTAGPAPLGDAWILAVDEALLSDVGRRSRRDPAPAERGCLHPAPGRPANCWYRRPIAGARCGPRASGRARSSSGESWPGRGNDRGRASRSDPGGGSRAPSVPQSNRRPSPCRWRGRSMCWSFRPTRRARPAVGPLARLRATIPAVTTSKSGAPYRGATKGTQ